MRRLFFFLGKRREKDGIKKEWEGRRFSGDLDGGVDLEDKEVARVEADGAGEDEEGEGHDEGVAKVEDGRDEGGDVELGHKVEDTVEEHVEG